MAADEILDPKKISGFQILIIFTCFFAMMLDGFDIVIISFTASAISNDLNLSPEQLGFIFSSGLIGMTMGAMFISSAADHFGRRIVIATALFVSGLATIAICNASNLFELVALRFIAGLGLGTLITVLPAIGAEFCPLHYRNPGIAIICSGGNLGAVVGGILTAWMIREHGWRDLYFYTGMVTSATGLAFFLIVPESLEYITSRKNPNGLEKVNRILSLLGQHTITKLPSTLHQSNEAANVTSLLTPSRKTNTFLAWGAFFFGFASMYFLTSWLPKLLVDSGFSEEDSIHSVVILTFGSIVGAILIGFMSRVVNLGLLISISFLFSSFLTMLLSFAIFGEAASLQAIWLLSFALGITLNGAFVNLYTIARSIYPPQVRITGIGWCYGLGRVGAILSPSIAGILIGIGLSSAALVLIFSIAIAASAVLVFKIKVDPCIPRMDNGHL